MGGGGGSCGCGKWGGHLGVSLPIALKNNVFLVPKCCQKCQDGFFPTHKLCHTLVC